MVSLALHRGSPRHAVREPCALKDDTAGLTYMAEEHGDRLGLSSERPHLEATAAFEAAGMLRVRAQQRLEELRVEVPVRPQDR